MEKKKYNTDSQFGLREFYVLVFQKPEDLIPQSKPICIMANNLEHAQELAKEEIEDSYPNCYKAELLEVSQKSILI